MTPEKKAHGSQIIDLKTRQLCEMFVWTLCHLTNASCEESLLIS